MKGLDELVFEAESAIYNIRQLILESNNTNKAIVLHPNMENAKLDMKSSLKWFTNY